MPAAPGVTDRLGQLDVLEKSVRDAKRALGAAEAAMQSVHSGLALEPMPVPPTPPRAIEPPPLPWELPPTPVFDRAQHFRRLVWAQVPLGVQAAALLLAGWCMAFFVMQLAGKHRTDRMMAAARSTLALLDTGKASPSSAAAIATDPNPPSSDAAAVVIYERTSPYPHYFADLKAKDRQCLAEAIYYEARGEPVAGQISVAQVVLNRTLAGSWPRTVCEVTHQGVENGEKCQFSYACQRRMLTAPFGDAWDNALGLAGEILQGGAWLEEMLDATHFHRSDLKPVWRLSLVEVGRFGRHTFYNSPTENRTPLSRVFAQ